MARGRMISKTLGTSSRRFARLRTDFPDVGLFAQALYPLLVANADDWGRQKADPFSVRYSVWSTATEDETVFASALNAMKDVGLVVLYSIGGETYAQIVDFDAHQRGLHKRTPSAFPPAPATDCGSSAAIAEVPQSSPLIELNLTEQKGRELARDGADELEKRFAKFWSRYPRQQGQGTARKAWMLIRPTAAHFDDIMAGLERWRASKQWQQAIAAGDLHFIKGPAKWLGEAAWTELQPLAPIAGAPRCRHVPRCTGSDVDCTAREVSEQLHPLQPVAATPLQVVAR